MSNSDRYVPVPWKAPYIAWPTVITFGCAVLGSIVSYILGSGMILPLGWGAFSFVGAETYTSYIMTVLMGAFCLILSSLSCYTQFTVAHDAIHSAISRNKNINRTIGFLAQLWLGPTSSWQALKYCHLEHHSHVNESDHDPDYWASKHGPGGAYLMPLRWITIDLSYFSTFIPYLVKQSWWYQLRYYVYQLGMFYLVYLAICAGYLSDMLWYWIIPSRIAIFFLSYLFDYLPHSPHTVTKSQNRLQTTAYISVPWILKPFVTYITFYQNYHIGHHWDPRLPFYRYPRVWQHMKDCLLDDKVIIKDIIPQVAGFQQLVSGKIREGSTMLEGLVTTILTDDEVRKREEEENKEKKDN